MRNPIQPGEVEYRVLDSRGRILRRFATLNGARAYCARLRATELRRMRESTFRDLSTVRAGDVNAGRYEASHV